MGVDFDMNIEDIELSKRFITCDLNKPYAFVSYSSLDYKVIWKDITHLQNMGYNIWIDHSLNGTEETWKEALLKIENPNCKYVLFYMSKNSITSIPCSEELNKTKDGITMKKHQDCKVPIVVIEVEDIPDIPEYFCEVKKPIVSNFNDENEEKLKALFSISSHFPNNDKPRIKFKNDIKRKTDYYDDICKAMESIHKFNGNQKLNYYFKSQKSLIESYLNDYIQRDKYQQEISEFIEKNTSGYILIQGEPEIGKTTFLCNLIKNTNAVHHFVSSNENRNKKSLILKSIIQQINTKMNLLTQELPENLDELVNIFSNLIQDYSFELSKNKVKDLLVIDEATDIICDKEDTPLNFLPEVLPNNIYVVLASNLSELNRFCPFYNYKINIQPFTEDQVKNLVLLYIRKNKVKYNITHIENLIKLCNGKPSQLVYFLKNYTGENYNDLVNEFSQKNLNMVNLDFRKWYSSESSIYQKIINVISLLSYTYDGIPIQECRSFAQVSKLEYSAVDKELSSYIFETMENEIRTCYLKDDRVRRYLNSPNSDYGHTTDEQIEMKKSIISYYELHKDSLYAKNYLIYHYFDLEFFDKVLMYFNLEEQDELIFKFLVHIFEHYDNDKIKKLLVCLNIANSPIAFNYLISFLGVQTTYGNFDSVDIICSVINKDRLSKNQMDNLMFCEAMLLRKNKKLIEARDVFLSLSDSSIGELKIKSLIQYANCLRELGHVRECMQIYYSVCTEENKEKYPLRYYETLQGINDRYYVNGALKKALAKNEDAIANCKKYGFELLSLKFYKMNAQIYRDMFEYEKGDAYFYEAYRLCKKLNDYGRQGEVLNLYCIQNSKLHPKSSLEIALDALKINTIVKGSIEMGKSYIGIALCYLYLNNFNAALHAIDDAIGIFIDCNYKSGLGKAFHEKGKIFLCMGKYSNALLEFKKSTEYFKRELSYSYPLYVIRNFIYESIIEYKTYEVTSIVEGRINSFEYDLLQTVDLYEYMDLQEYIKKCVWLLAIDFEEILQNSANAEGLIEGYNNINKIFDIGDYKYMLRIQKNSTHTVYDVKFFQEADIIELVYSKGIKSPMILYKDNRNNSMIYPYIQGATLYEKYSYSSIENWQVVKIAEFFRKLHSIDVKELLVKTEYSTCYEFYSYIYSKYKQICLNIYQKHNDIFDELGLDVSKVFENSSQLQLNSRSIVLCHCDCHRKNIIASNEDLYYIDWELSLLADPLYDIAIHIQKMFYNEAQKELFLSNYFKKTDDVIISDLNSYLQLEAIKYAYTDLIRILEGKDSQASIMISRYQLKLQNVYHVLNISKNMSLETLNDIILKYKGSE